MHSALVVVTKPGINDSVEMQKWHAFSKHQNERAAPALKGKELGENVWLIPLSNGLPSLTSLLQDAQSNGFAYKVLFLSEEPTWSKFTPAQQE